MPITGCQQIDVNIQIRRTPCLALLLLLYLLTLTSYFFLICFYLFLNAMNLTPSVSTLSLPPLQGKKNSVFRECYFGSQRHCKLTRLFPACGYTFRVAAHNDIGTRYCCILLKTHQHNIIIIITTNTDGSCHNSLLFPVYMQYGMQASV